MKSPKVFISYCHLPETHREKVIEFAAELGKLNVEVSIDAYVQNKILNWNEWCKDEIYSADYVIVVCNMQYLNRYENKAPKGIGKGAKWEGYIINRILWEEEGNSKFVPVAFNETDWNYRPKILSVANSFLIKDKGSFDDLSRLLFGKPRYSPPQPTDFDPDKELLPYDYKGFFNTQTDIPAATKQEVMQDPYPRYLRTNRFGIQEYLWETDNSVLIKIPKGEFVYGDNLSPTGSNGRRNYELVDLPGYFIDKYAITNEQYKTFVEATKYVTDAEKIGHAFTSDFNKNWRKERGRTWKSFCNKETINHPVVMVSPNDAIAYCNWAKKRLPSSYEWEKAARGELGQLYPWGNDFKNELHYANFGLIAKGTQPVDSHPLGVSPYGCMNMAGNVWEWCLEEKLSENFDHKTDKSEFELSNRLLYVNRGSSWFDDEEYKLRCYHGSLDEPGAFFHLGFRCVLNSGEQ